MNFKTGCPKCRHETIIGVQYGRYYDPVKFPNHYDGISEYRCNECGYREGRWCGKELKEGEEEARFCTGENPHPLTTPNEHTDS